VNASKRDLIVFFLMGFISATCMWIFFQGGKYEEQREVSEVRGTDEVRK